MSSFPELDYPVKLNIVNRQRIKTNKYGYIHMYTIKPCKRYSKTELLAFTMNNPKHSIYHPEEDVFYMDYYAFSYLSHESDGRFYSLFLEACKRQDPKEAAAYVDANSKYLKEYARILIEIKEIDDVK